MNKSQPQHPSPGLTIGDIYHVLFRHKWKILFIWVLGIAAAGALWHFWPVKYSSDARLLIRYVLDNRPLSPIGGGADVQTPDSRGDGIINSEAAMFSSFDLAKDVAASVGPSNILAKLGGGNDLNRAAGAIAGGINVQTESKSPVITVTFEHPDPNLVQPVLGQLIASYLKMHTTVHQAGGTLDDLLTQQTDQLHSQVQQTEDALRAAKARVGIISIADANQSFATRITRIKGDLINAEADLAAQEAVLGELTNRLSATSTNASLSPFASIPPEKVADYKRVCGLLDDLTKKELSLLLQFTPESNPVKTIQAQIDQNRKIKDQLEKEFPAFLTAPALTSSSRYGQDNSQQWLFDGIAKARALQARINFLNAELVNIENQMTNINNSEGEIADLERKLALQSTNYYYMSASLEKTRTDEALSAGKASNINVIQAPTPPGKDIKKLYKLLAATLVGAFAGGLALAFALELYVDRSFRRPAEIEDKLSVPLFLSIPRTHFRGNQLNGAAIRGLLQDGGTNRNGDSKANGMTVGTGLSKDGHVLSSHFETLRDRLMLYFEAKELRHKPKLVAVTSCAEGSGVSTVAAGLAASLSETGEGNVLLVDMNDVERGVAHHFHKGKLECGLEDALESEKRDEAMVQDRLYVVSETASSNKLPQILHKRYSSLLPRLRASDYDYIIFDMPPVSQISPTTRLARFMDMVFMVVEAERTDRDVVKRATDLLTETKANVGVVLNKQRRYVPKSLQQEL